MTLGEFRKRTKNMPDTTLMVVPGSDHSFERAGFHKMPAAIDEDGYIEEEWPGSEGESVEVIVVE